MFHQENTNAASDKKKPMANTGPSPERLLADSEPVFEMGQFEEDETSVDNEAPRKALANRMQPRCPGCVHSAASFKSSSDRFHAFLYASM